MHHTKVSKAVCRIWLSNLVGERDIKKYAEITWQFRLLGDLDQGDGNGVGEWGLRETLGDEEALCLKPEDGAAWERPRSWSRVLGRGNGWADGPQNWREAVVANLSWAWRERREWYKIVIHLKRKVWEIDFFLWDFFQTMSFLQDQCSKLWAMEP